MIWHKLRSLPCKIQRASLQLFCLLMSYLLLRWHWNMCNKFLLAFFTFFFLATFLIRLGKKKPHQVYFLKRSLKSPSFICSARRNQTENDQHHKHKKKVNGTKQQRNVTSTTFRSCSLTFSALLLPFFIWLLLCCGMGMNVKLYSLLSHSSLAVIAKL